MGPYGVFIGWIYLPVCHIDPLASPIDGPLQLIKPTSNWADQVSQPLTF